MTPQAFAFNYRHTAIPYMVLGTNLDACVLKPIGWSTYIGNKALVALRRILKCLLPISRFGLRSPFFRTDIGAQPSIVNYDAPEADGSTKLGRQFL